MLKQLVTTAAALSLAGLASGLVVPSRLNADGHVAECVDQYDLAFSIAIVAARPKGGYDYTQSTIITPEEARILNHDLDANNTQSEVEESPPPKEPTPRTPAHEAFFAGLHNPSQGKPAASKSMGGLRSVPHRLRRRQNLLSSLVNQINDGQVQANPVEVEICEEPDDSEPDTCDNCEDCQGDCDSDENDEADAKADPPVRIRIRPEVPKNYYTVHIKKPKKAKPERPIRPLQSQSFDLEESSPDLHPHILIQPIEKSPLRQIDDGQIQAQLAKRDVREFQNEGDHSKRDPQQPMERTAEKAFAESLGSAYTSGQIEYDIQQYKELSDGSALDLAYVCAEKLSSSKVPYMSLQYGNLMDSRGRYAYIGADRKLTFANPVHHDAVITSGFGVCSNSTISLGGSTIFYSCLGVGDDRSGSGIYDRPVDGYCHPVHLELVSIIGC